jgi:Ca2+-binding EF-hand superfamily protein
VQSIEESLPLSQKLVDESSDYMTQCFIAAKQLKNVHTPLDRIAQSIKLLVDSGMVSSDIFDLFDRDGETVSMVRDGCLSKDELYAGLVKINVALTDKELDSVFAEFDEDGDDEITRGEWLAFIDKHCMQITESSIRSQALQLWHKFVQPENLVEMQQLCIDLRAGVSALCAKWDADDDGRLSVAEIRVGIRNNRAKLEDSIVDMMVDILMDGKPEINRSEFADGFYALERVLSPTAGKVESDQRAHPLQYLSQVSAIF